MASEVPWKGLHPVSLAVNLVPRAWSMVRNTWYIFVAIFLGRLGPSSPESIIDLGIVVLFFAMAVGSTVVHFLTLRYRVVDGRLEIKSGLLNRQVRVIGADRIQNVELIRNVFHRLSGMVEVRLETASGREVEGLLSALSVEAAQELTDALDAARGDARPSTEEVPPEDVVLRNTPIDLVWFGVTATRFGGIAVMLGLLYEGFVLNPELVSDDVQETTTGLLSGVGGIVLVVALVSGAWLVGTATAVVRFFGFRLVRSGPALVAEQGLLTKRRVVLRLGKVQLVTIEEPWLRRLAGFGSVAIETAAARPEGDGTQRSEAVVPYVARQDIATVVGSAIPLESPGSPTPLDPTSHPLHPPHPRALIRASAAALGQSAVLAAGISWWLFPYGLFSLLLVPVALVVARLDHQHQGWAVTSNLVVSRRGWLTRRTWLLARNKVQSTSLQQGPILRRYGLGVLQVRVAGGLVELPAMGWEEALDLQQALLPRSSRMDAR